MQSISNLWSKNASFVSSALRASSNATAQATRPCATGARACTLRVDDDVSYSRVVAEARQQGTLRTTRKAIIDPPDIEKGRLAALRETVQQVVRECPQLEELSIRPRRWETRGCGGYDGGHFDDPIAMPPALAEASQLRRLSFNQDVSLCALNHLPAGLAELSLEIGPWSGDMPQGSKLSQTALDTINVTYCQSAIPFRDIVGQLPSTLKAANFTFPYMNAVPPDSRSFASLPVGVKTLALDFNFNHRSVDPQWFHDFFAALPSSLSSLQVFDPRKEAFLQGLQSAGIPSGLQTLSIQRVKWTRADADILSQLKTKHGSDVVIDLPIVYDEPHHVTL